MAEKRGGKTTGTPGTRRSLKDSAEDRITRSPERDSNPAGQTQEELIHELEVHQVELEMQAEQLRIAQFDLEESRDKYLDLYEFAPLGYLTLNEKARITEVNLTGAKLLGVERKKLVSHKLGRFIAPRDLENWDRYFKQVLARVGKQTCTISLKRGDGSVFPARLESVRLTGFEEGSTTVRVAVSDITDLVEGEEALRLFKSVFDHATEACVISDASGHFVYINKAHENLFGRTLEEARKLNYRDYYPPESVGVLDSLVAPLLERGEDWEGELEVFDAAGRRFPLWERAGSILDPSGRLLYGFGFMHDITARKEAEEAIRQANRKLTLLSGITRHDISNQLTVLQGYLALLEKQQPDPAFTGHFKKINAAAQQISAMIRFTKEYEKIGVTAPAWQDCRALVDTAAKENPVENIVVDNDLPAAAEVFADPLIGRVFYNLVDNAVRYGGKIQNIRFSAQACNGDHIIVCEDDGAGVPAEEKEKIFERGFGKNTDLGLALSREILDITGISIRETGEPGRGARFEITVPNENLRMKPLSGHSCGDPA